MFTKLLAGTAAAAAVAMLLQVPTASAQQWRDQQAWQYGGGQAMDRGGYQQPGAMQRDGWQQPGAMQRDRFQHRGAMRGMQAQYRQVTGEILDIRAIPIHGVDAENVLVLLETERGNRVVVDLGDRIGDVDLQAGDRLQARGEIVDIDGRRPILFANTFRHDGETHETNRVAYFPGYDDGPGYGGGDQR
jgi:hypothetical protein